jgi:hypothetical protein
MHYDCNPSYNIFSVCVCVFYFALLLAVISKTKVATLPNLVQRLFADVINDAIWFMNIHEQNHP